MWFVKNGARVTITDMPEDQGTRKGWNNTNQWASSVASAFRPGIVDRKIFEANVDFAAVDMNKIPQDLLKNEFDFIWSCGSLEHVGSADRAEAFIKNSLKCLKPGGIAVHTTEFTVSSLNFTLEIGNLVTFSKTRMDSLVQDVRRLGYESEDIDYRGGTDPVDQHIDIQPYRGDNHLKLAGYGLVIHTSIGIIIRAPM